MADLPPLFELAITTHTREDLEDLARQALLEVERLRADRDQRDQRDREQRAATWDECWKVAGDYAAALMLGKRVPEPPNPYREATP